MIIMESTGFGQVMLHFWLMIRTIIYVKLTSELLEMQMELKKAVD